MHHILFYTLTINYIGCIARQLDIDTNWVASTVDENFVSVSIDTARAINHWNKIDFKSARFVALVKALSPSYLRFGGIAADFLIFNESCMMSESNAHQDDPLLDDDGNDVTRKNHSNFCFSELDLERLFNFSRKANTRLIFGLNVLSRNAKNEWQPDNARLLLDACSRKGYLNSIDFELGNEPNAYNYLYHVNITADQLADDYRVLYELLQQFYPNETFNIFGPDVSGIKRRTVKYLSGFLKKAWPYLKAYTWHQYYVDGAKATVDDFVNSSVLDSFKRQIKEVQIRLKKERLHLNGWLGETSSCWSGGARNISDRFVAGFMWLDKLGISAELGIKVVVRQSLLHASYALLDKYYFPTPDYWLTWIFKNLVGRKVFTVKNKTKLIRFYAHCGSGIWASAESLVVYGLNLKKKAIRINFTSVLRSYEKSIYWLQSKFLTSKEIFLNGKLLQLVNNTLPSVSPVIRRRGAPIRVPAFTFGFIVFRNSHFKLCENL